MTMSLIVLIVFLKDLTSYVTLTSELIAILKFFFNGFVVKGAGF